MLTNLGPDEHLHAVCENGDPRYHYTNPLVTLEDIKDHNGIAGVFHNDDKILVFWHNKYHFWTIPTGKSPLMSDPDVGFQREMEEEVGVFCPPSGYELLGTFLKYYSRGNKVQTRVRSYVYDIAKYHGELKNMEPHKHPKMEWMTIEELEALPETSTSDVTRFYIALKKIIAVGSRKLINGC